MIYIIVTTSLLQTDFNLRELQYTIGISKLLEYIDTSLNIKVVIVENNGLRSTFLNNFPCDILYTENNKIPTINKGIKELKDIFDCIDYFKINDDDFIVKITGRYILEHNSKFIELINNYSSYNTDCIIRFGCYSRELENRKESCVTGLIGMKCKYVKQIKMPTEESECVEWNWAKVAASLDNIIELDTLGIHICPGGNEYRFI